MSSTIKFVVLWIVEVNEIYKQFSALLTSEASGMPAFLCAHTLCKDPNTAHFNGHFAFFTDLRKGRREGRREGKREGGPERMVGEGGKGERSSGRKEREGEREEGREWLGKKGG